MTASDPVFLIPAPPAGSALGGPERTIAVTCDVTEWEQQEALVATTLERFGRLDAAFANAGFGAARGFTAESPGYWRSMLLTDVYGAALTILRDDRGAEGQPRPPAADGLGRGAACASWIVVLGDEVGGDGDGRVRSPGAQRHRVRVTVIEPGRVDTPFFDKGAGPWRAEARRCRAVGYARAVPAVARRRQRDPGQADSAAELRIASRSAMTASASRVI